QMLEAAPQAVEAPHYEGIPLAKHGLGLRPAGPLCTGAADVILEDALAARLLQGVALQLQVLVERADARVTDDHDLSQKVSSTGIMIHLQLAPSPHQADWHNLFPSFTLDNSSRRAPQAQHADTWASPTSLVPT